MIAEKERYEHINLFADMETQGNYDIPVIKPVSIDEYPEFIGFNYAMSEKHPQDKGVHFFVDDYQFTRLWNDPGKYLPLIKKFKCVFTPDFSLYTDYPNALQIYNHWRKHVLGAYWQSEGITVIPTIAWSGINSFRYCFDGEPVGGCVAVSSVGTQNNRTAKKLFLQGYEEMMKRLEPSTVVFMGKVPKECEGNIVHINTFSDKFRRAE